MQISLPSASLGRARLSVGTRIELMACILAQDVLKCKTNSAFSLPHKHLPNHLDIMIRMDAVPKPDLLYREFGLLLAAERKRKHLTQAQFAARVGLSRTSVTNIECGRQPVQLHQLYLFASVLRIPAQALLPREPATEPLERRDALDEQAQYLIEAKKYLSKAPKSLGENRHE
jgi:transcriptional regulator with XRE-family HTH domain